MTTEVESPQKALELERLDGDLLVSLWKPISGRGVFGGQVIGQATWAATNSVDPSLKLHSLCVRRPSGPHAHSHSYFLSFGSNEKPIVYHVEKLRDGRSYATRTVKAVQNGNAIFTLTASFQKPEPAQPRFSIPMPKGPATIEGTPEDWLSLEASTPQEVEIQNELDERGSDMSPKMREYLMRFMEERRQSSIEVRAACPRRPRRTDRSVEPMFEQGFWIRSRQKGVDDGAFQKCDGDDQCRADARRCILAYASDLQFIGTAARALGLSARSNPRLAMMASLDHSIWFYDGNGRGMVQGEIWNSNGTLVMIVAQEGVVRAQTQDRMPQKPRL